MSGDVQPRKRKDKKKKKDELGVEEPRGTAAVFGEGDVFIHSQHEHGTGGHWCAKIIFFSLLAVLITLIGLIILENRGLTELEANSVESRYSGVLEGWLEDAHDDDHHDEHTLELKHHDEEHEEEEQEDSGIEVEKLEKEVTDDLEQASVEEDVADHDDKSEDVSAQEDDTDLPDDDEFLEADDVDDLPVVEHIVAPKGKPFVEVEEEPTTVKPADTLADEEEYEKQQEQLRQEQEQASHMWLKLVVGGALLVATHAVVRRATATRDDASSEEHETREDTPSAIDRRMTLIPPEPTASAPPREALEQKVNPVVREKIFEKVSSTVKSAPIKNKNDDDSEDEQKKGKEVKQAEVIKDTEQDKELYSDDEEAEDEEMVEEEKVEEISQDGTKTLDIEAEESELPDDVEIIDEEQLGEELEEEEEEEEDISDVDDAELLNRLEAKYGRLPEPERPERKHKDGGNSIDDWPGEPSDQYWRQQLDQAEEELRRDWLD